MRPLRRQPAVSWDPEPDPVVLRRAGRLRDAGFSPQLAVRVAQDYGYDLQAVLELIDRGCPPEFAVRILAPN